MSDKWLGAQKYGNITQPKQRYYCLHNNLCLDLTEHLNFKPRKNSTPRPAVKFYDVKSKIFSKSGNLKKDRDSELPDDDEDDSWLDEQQETMYDSAQELEAELTSPINLASTHLASFLADSPIDINSETQVLPAKPQAAASATVAEDNNDFSMEF